MTDMNRNADNGGQLGGGVEGGWASETDPL